MVKKEGFVKDDVTHNIKKPKFSKNIADKTITQEERDRILQAFDKDVAKKRSLGYIHNDFQARIWFKPLINTVFYTGLRRSEVVKLKWRQVDLDKGIIVVAGKTKGHKERAIPLRKELLPILKKWKEKSGKENRFVFPSRKKGFEGTKMSGPNITRVYKKYVRLAGIKSSANLHGLRHTCGTELLRNYYDINGVAKVLGHSDLKVTQEYDHLNTEDLVDKMRQFEGEVDEMESLRKENEELKEKLKALETEATVK